MSRFGGIVVKLSSKSRYPYVVRRNPYEWSVHIAYERRIYRAFSKVGSARPDLSEVVFEIAAFASRRNRDHFAVGFVGAENLRSVLPGGQEFQTWQRCSKFKPEKGPLQLLADVVVAAAIARRRRRLSAILGPMGPFDQDLTGQNVVENTAATRPEKHFVGMLASDSYGPDMESAGQRQLAGSTWLPAEGDWDALCALGFAKGDPVPGDPLFVEATTPAGWIRQSTDNAMCVEILDERGLPRVGIFYKAAFYDRDAHFWIIDVGAHVASCTLRRTEAPVEVPAQWGLLTGAEKAAACEHLRQVGADRWSVTSDELWERAKQLLPMLSDARE